MSKHKSVIERFKHSVKLSDSTHKPMDNTLDQPGRYKYEAQQIDLGLTRGYLKAIVLGWDFYPGPAVVTKKEKKEPEAKGKAVSLEFVPPKEIPGYFELLSRWINTKNTNEHEELKWLFKSLKRHMRISLCGYWRNCREEYLHDTEWMNHVYTALLCNLDRYFRKRRTYFSDLSLAHFHRISAVCATLIIKDTVEQEEASDDPYAVEPPNQNQTRILFHLERDIMMTNDWNLGMNDQEKEYYSEILKKTQRLVLEKYPSIRRRACKRKIGDC